MSDIKITSGNWQTHPLDRRCVVDENEYVVADVRNWRDTDDAEVISQVPQMWEIVQALSGSTGNWADDWLNELAAKATAVEERILSKIKKS